MNDTQILDFLERRIFHAVSAVIKTEQTKLEAKTTKKGVWFPALFFPGQNNMSLRQAVIEAAEAEENP